MKTAFHNENIWYLHFVVWVFVLLTFYVVVIFSFFFTFTRFCICPIRKCCRNNGGLPINIFLMNEVTCLNKNIFWHIEIYNGHFNMTLVACVSVFNQMRLGLILKVLYPKLVHEIKVDDQSKRRNFKADKHVNSPEFKYSCTTHSCFFPIWFCDVESSS